MQYTYPDYYKKFKCIADKCQDTCCAGWQIVIDDDSLKKYKAVKEEHTFKERLEQSIDWDESVFRQDKCRRCAFLNDKNLCDMYTALGEGALCETCTNYPRHIEEFENIREITLSLSCPEVARIILSKTDKVTFYNEEDDKMDDEEDYFAFDELMLGVLQDIRSDMLVILQDRTKEMSLRVATVWEMAEKMQGYIDEGSIFACEDILYDYSKKTTISKVNAKLQRFANNPKRRYKFALDMFKKLYRLEVLMEDWTKLVDDTSLTLYGRDEAYYNELCREFDAWLDENMPQWNIQCEQIVVYFLFTYLCGAVYDGWVAAKVKMSVAAVFYIHELLMARWIDKGKMLDFEDVVNITYRYSRELEHSDINLDEMEESMNE